MSTEIILVLIVCLALVIFSLLARIVQKLIWKNTFSDMLSKENMAAGIEYAGYFLGVLIVVSAVLGAISFSERSITKLIESGALTLQEYCMQIAVYGVFGVVALALFGHLGLRLLMKTDIAAGVTANNTAAAVVAATAHISTALIIAGVVSGENHTESFAPTPVFLGIGLCSLWLVIYLFRFITRYDDSQEITNGNVAAALSYGGMMIAAAIIIGHSLEGDFVDYESSFLLYRKSLIAVVILYPVRQFIVQGILLHGGFKIYGGVLDEEIGQDHNIGAGAVEAAAYIASAFLALHLGY